MSHSDQVEQFKEQIVQLNNQLSQIEKKNRT